MKTSCFTMCYNMCGMNSMPKLHIYPISECDVIIMRTK